MRLLLLAQRPDDIVNGTNALVYKEGDLEQLGGSLDHMLSDGVDGREQRCGFAAARV